MARLEVEIVGDSRSLERAFARSERSAKSFGRNMERAGRGTVAATFGFRGLGRAVSYASASFLGAAGFTAAIKAGFDEMFAGEKVAAQTAATLKSTGRVAGVTAKQINTLAGSMQKLTGYDDEAIQSAENLLLTFTNIRNVAGRNNDIFNQATEATLNLSRTFDQDLSASAIQLGKALQDPVRGVTALRRIGVSFTEAQRRLINRLVETGNVLEAQKIILREVTRETGNSARAYGQTLPGQLDILRGNLQNLAGELAQTLNPEVKKLTDRFNKWLENPEHKKKVIDDFAASAHGLGEAFQGVAAGIQAASSAYGEFRDLTAKAPGGKGGFLATLLGGTIFGQLKSFAATAKKLGIQLGIRKPPGGGRPVGIQGPQITKVDLGPPGLGGPLTGAAPPGAGGVTRQPKGITAAQRNAWFDAMINRQLGRVQDIASLRGQIARLGQIAQLIRDRMAATKDITRRLTLEDQLLEVLRTQRATRTTLSEEIKQRALDAAEAAKAAREAALETKRGWLDFAVERAETTKTIKDDLQAYRAIEKFLLARIRKEGRTLELVRDLWETRQKIRDLNKKNADVDPLAGLQQVSSRQLANILAAGTGLGLRGRQRLGMNIAGAEIQPLHVHVNIDGREVGRAVTKDQARTGRRTAHQTSGYRA